MGDAGVSEYENEREDEVAKDRYQKCWDPLLGPMAEES